MNIQRYKWPVIIAAGLHGALFLGTSDATDSISTPPTRPKITEPRCWNPPIEMDRAETDADGESSPRGGGNALPELPDKVAVLPDRDVFTVEVKREAPDKGVTGLENHDGRPVGPGTNWDGPVVTAIFSPAKLDRVPRATVQISPEYPAPMRRDGITGSVTVEFDVNTEGRVVRAEAVSYTHREFAEPAVRAVRKWHFEPGRRHGHVVPFRMVIPMEFSLAAD